MFGYFPFISIRSIFCVLRPSPFLCFYPLSFPSISFPFLSCPLISFPFISIVVLSFSIVVPFMSIHVHSCPSFAIASIFFPFLFFPFHPFSCPFMKWKWKALKMKQQSRIKLKLHECIKKPIRSNYWSHHLRFDSSQVLKSWSVWKEMKRNKRKSIHNGPIENQIHHQTQVEDSLHNQLKNFISYSSIVEGRRVFFDHFPTSKCISQYCIQI